MVFAIVTLNLIKKIVDMKSSYISNKKKQLVLVQHLKARQLKSFSKISIWSFLEFGP